MSVMQHVKREKIVVIYLYQNIFVDKISFARTRRLKYSCFTYVADYISSRVSKRSNACLLVMLSLAVCLF